MMQWRSFVEVIARKAFPNSSRGTASRIETGHRAAVDLYADGHYAESEERFAKNVILARSFGEHSNELVAYLRKLGDFYHSSGNYSSAEQPLLEALRIKEAREDMEDGGVAPVLNDVALLYYAQGRYQEAEKAFQRLAALLEAQAPASVEMAICLENHAACLRRLDREEDSTRLTDRARQIRESS